ncbi:MAG TPA: baseplate J/gp47 family protein [Thermoanaerobaculia bacterium]|nr:baseplate J/gp47 family protein [Thermoanaerobaculia bacterium]
MSAQPSIRCPRASIAENAQGILRVEVHDDTAQLVVRFAQDVSDPSQAFLFQPGSYTLTGGDRIFPRVVSVAPAPFNPPGTPAALIDRRVLLQLDRIGDFSIYTLTVSGPGLDPFFSSIKLRFRLECDAAFDCRPPGEREEETVEPEVAIDYLSKDYASFRQALLDFIPTRLPAWTERSEADIGVMLLELLAATADTLSYNQDRIANEAFLETARERRSVAGHLALIGYELDEGASALTWLKLDVNAVQTVQVGLRVSTRKVREADAVIVFETLVPITVRPDHNRLALFDFTPLQSPPVVRDCCLPKGSLSADLAGALPDLEVGAWLLFEDSEGPRREAVRITAKEIVQPEPGEIVPTGPRTVVHWSAATPLRHEYCVRRTTVYANVVPATHGETARDRFVTPTASKPVRLRFELTHAPLAHLDPSAVALTLPPGEALQTDDDILAGPVPRSVSTLRLTIGGEKWTQQSTLLDSDDNDAVYRIEIDSDGEATIVTGNGVFGRRPSGGLNMEAEYRVGGGDAGNVAAETLLTAHPSETESLAWLNADGVTNPLPATGGRDRESLERARRFGPATFGDPLMLVTARDYERAAESIRDAAGQLLVQRARTIFRWTGSWLTVFTAIDPTGEEDSSRETIAAVLRVLDARRLAGYDLEIVAASYLPLDVIVGFCAQPAYNTADVQKRLEEALAAFFDPDNFSFGDSVFVSRLYSAAMAVQGVESVRIARLSTLHAADPVRDTATNLAQGFLAVGGDQVVRLENDRNHPGRGTLSVRPMGGHA